MDNRTYEINTPQSEQEVPPHASRSVATTSELPKSAVDELEKENQAKKLQQELHLKDNAFILLCACLFSFVIFYLIDTIVINSGFKSSSVLSSAIDMAKTIVTFLVGYLFASEKPKN